MISRLHITNYKCLHDEDMEFRPLTVLTGTNSSGKSSVLQTVLLLARNCNPKNRDRMYDLISEYQELACDASLTLDGTEYRYITGSDKNSDADILRWEESLYFLTANRVGPEKIAKMSSEYKVGDNGEFLFRTLARLKYCKSEYITIDDLSQWNLPVPAEGDLKYQISNIVNSNVESRDEQENMFMLSLYNSIANLKNKIVIDEEEMSAEKIDTILNTLKEKLHLFYLNKQKCVVSLSSLVNLWMNHITEVHLYIDSVQLETGYAQIYFTHDGTDMISPYNLGSGMSYLAKVLILCFLAKPGDVVMIENPEIHLHPRAQSRLGEFFAFMAGKGIQLVIETHCEHLLSSLRYQVYKDRLRSDDVILYYKADDKTPFEQLRISKNGRYMNREGKQCGFPKGFFDVSVDQLMEIG